MVEYRFEKGKVYGKMSSGGEFVVDLEDIYDVMPHNWYRNGANKVVSTKINGKNVTLARLILNITDDDIYIVHKDDDKLNLTRENLSIQTIESFNRNRQSNKKQKYSKYKGVSYHRNKWCAQIHMAGKKYHLGLFEKEDEAAEAYNEAAVKHWGNKIKINKIGSPGEFEYFQEYLKRELEEIKKVG